MILGLVQALGLGALFFVLGFRVVKSGLQRVGMMLAALAVMAVYHGAIHAIQGEAGFAYSVLLEDLNEDGEESYGTAIYNSGEERDLKLYNSFSFFSLLRLGFAPLGYLLAMWLSGQPWNEAGRRPPPGPGFLREDRPIVSTIFREGRRDPVTGQMVRSYEPPTFATPRESTMMPQMSPPPLPSLWEPSPPVSEGIPFSKPSYPPPPIPPPPEMGPPPLPVWAREGVTDAAAQEQRGSGPKFAKPPPPNSY